MWDYYMVLQNTCLHVFESYCTAADLHWPARALPWSSVLDTYRISEDWLSRFVGIKMQRTNAHETLTELQPRRNEARDKPSLLQEAGSWERKKISGWSNCIVVPSKISSLHPISEVYPAPAAACRRCWPPFGCFLREAPWPAQRAEGN